jgi:hypothetical protein
MVTITHDHVTCGAYMWAGVGVYQGEGSTLHSSGPPLSCTPFPSPAVKKIHNTKQAEQKH